jgi:5-methylcytosine-specific restriction endonuclease McrA
MGSQPDGRTVAAWAGRAKVEATRRVNQLGRSRVDGDGRPDPAPCVICGQPIDYDLPTSHPDSCSVQHLKPRSTHPWLTWDPSNWAPAHLQCNKADGPRGNTARTNLGILSTNW